MTTRFLRHLAPIFILFLSAAGHAAAQDYPGFPDTIMAPAPGALPHHRGAAPHRMTHAQAAHLPRTPAGKQHGRRVAVARGSSGSVLPAPLPRTPLIPPEGGGTAAVPIAPEEPGPTIVPGLANPVPNLAHGPETFQDRASRCAFQQGLYNVPGNMSTQYMGACLQ
jgi:hypothetical protein